MRSRRSARRNERGAVAIVVAISMTLLLVVAAMVLDFGIVRLDKTKMKSATDSAVMAGLRAADGKTGDVFTWRGVCGALAFLKANEPDLASAPAGTCAAPDESVVCDNSTTPVSGAATYDSGEFSANGSTYKIVIKSPYLVTDGNFSEESYGSLSDDRSASDGCDQLGVIVTQSRSPGLGSLATNSDMVTRVRSVGRVAVGSNDELSPALILLERTNCSALTIGSAGTTTYIRVKGLANIPGSIHLDSDATGSDCGTGSNQQLAQGKQADGIVAYGAPTGGSTGIISSYASFKNQPDARVYDNIGYVYGTTATGPGIAGTSTKVQARNRVGRRPVDIRYRPSVRTAITAAAPVWSYTSTNLPAGWASAGCNPSAAALTNTVGLFIDCTRNAGITLTGTTIMASNVVFNGFVKGGDVAMPNATRVYVKNTSSSGSTINSDAVSLSNGNGFCVRSSTCAANTGAVCSSTATPNRARLFVRQGNLNASGGILRMCNTTTFLLGGDQAAGCVPSTNNKAPTPTPCTTSPTTGNSLLVMTGGSGVDWTAPNEYASTIPLASQSTAWSNFEDLALWSESASTDSNPYKLIGGGTLNTVGVFFTPNASPFQVGGGGAQILTNAQFVARRFNMNGGGQLTMTTDPRNAVSLPALTGFTLIR